jgi:molybdopterin-guanine dinucleotide biosynthesis protein
MIRQPNFMIVSGNGRNTGKTTFVCEVIRSICKEYHVTAIKVSPHFHNNHSPDPIFEGAGFTIWEETEENRAKDSSRMLQSGADRVFYIESKDNSLVYALDNILPLMDPGQAVICESGGMRKHIEPSLMILLNEDGRDEKKSSYMDLLPIADACVAFNGKEFDLAPGRIRFDGTSWMLDMVL